MIQNSLKTRGYHVGVRFAPVAVFDKAHRQEFQNKLSQGFDWRRQEFADKTWVLSAPQGEGDPRSHVKLTLQPDQLNFEEIFPLSTLDLFVDSLRLALEGVADVFGPRVLLGSGAMIRLTLEAVGGDARFFLGNRCLHLEDRLRPIGRPVHAVGLKFVLPPVPAEGQTATPAAAAVGAGQQPWQATVKIESLIEDVRQLFVEVDAVWGTPCAWSLDAIAERVRTASAFAAGPVVAFLSQYAEPAG